ncbi:MAG: transglutaminase domain-containing protein [Oscillospiraceae bacterium]
MNKNRITALTAALLAAALMLSACGNSSEADWEDTLPSAVTTVPEKEVTVIEAETTPPISISVPETTTTSEKSTELATTTAAIETSSETSSETTIGTSSETTTTTSVTVTTVPKISVSSTVSTSPTNETSNQSTTTSVQETSAAETLETAVEDLPSSEFIYPKDYSTTKAYVYSTLDNDKKAVYDAMLTAIKSHANSFQIPEDVRITGDEYVELYQLIYDFEYSIFDLDVKIRYTSDSRSGNVVSAQLSYLYTAEQVDDMIKKSDAAADEIISELGDGKSEYETVKFFYDKLASEIEYNENAENLRDIYGALVDKSTVCGGYAKAFSYLCSKVGIETITMLGDFNETPHMWNMVKIDGEWYHIDVTSGNAMNTDFPYIRYDYFCVTDDIINKYHVVYDQPFDYPKAASEKYNYFIYNNLVASDVPDAAALISEEIIKASQNHIPAIQFVCADDKTYEDVIFYLFDPDQRHAIDIYENTYDSAETKYKMDSIQYHSDPKTRVIKLFLQYIDN